MPSTNEHNDIMMLRTTNRVTRRAAFARILTVDEYSSETLVHSREQTCDLHRKQAAGYDNARISILTYLRATALPAPYSYSHSWTWTSERGSVHH